MDLNAVSLFCRVAQLGSFTAAARDLGVPKSTVSAKIAKLESELGIHLLKRSTRSMTVTEAGQRFLAAALHGLSELDAAADQLLAEAKEPRGLLRLTAPVEMGSVLLPPYLAEFQRRYPKVELDVLLDDRRVDLIHENVDLAIRAGHLQDSRLKAKRIGYSRFQLFASPAYLKKHGAPQKPSELSEHSCLHFSNPSMSRRWDLSRGEQQQQSVTIVGGMSVNNLLALKQLAREGLGIAALPNFLCQQELDREELVVILPRWMMRQTPIHLVYVEQTFMPLRLRVLIDYLSQMNWPFS